MCFEWCKYCKNWLKSFTKTEVVLLLVDGVLLALCIAFMVFVVIHFMLCTPSVNKHESEDNVTNAITTDDYSEPTEEGPTHGSPTNESPTDDSTTHDSTTHDSTTDDSTDTDENTDESVSTGKTPYHTKKDEVKCSWTPSAKTKASSIYFKGGTEPITSTTAASEDSSELPEKSTKNSWNNIVDEVLGNLTDGELAEKKYTNHILALVKIRNFREITFGCILTIVSKHWVLTAASCVEAIEEVDTLDAFIMLEGYGQQTLGATHSLSDVKIHPEYQGVNRSHDLAALATEDELLPDNQKPIQLPTLVDYLLITIGEKVTILGYGKFRSVAARPSERRLNRFEVYWLPAGQCQQEQWQLRHLGSGPSVAEAACGPREACAGVLSARGSACQYCAGTPLLRARTLLGIMSDNKLCAAACEPALYVNIAVVSDWIRLVISGS